MKIYRNIEQWSLEWLDLRKGLITWTKLEAVNWWPKAQLTAIYKLLAEKYIAQDDNMTAWEIIQRWHDLEPQAKELYKQITWEKVEDVWFVKANKFIWLSPDGLIKKKGAYRKAIEIKCPMWAKYIQYLLENKIPSEYEEQIINYFICLPLLEELDLIIYNPDTKDWIKSIHIINVKKEELIDKIESIKEKLIDFQEKWIQLDKKLLFNN